VPLSRLIVSLVLTALFSCALAVNASWASPSSWVSRLRENIDKLDAATPGELGVYVKRITPGHSNAAEVFSWNAERSWYLASTTKIPVAVTVLKAAEQGQLSLDEELVIKESSYVDGGGLLFSRKPGEKVTIEELLRLMLVESDSTAADLLIKRIGTGTINNQMAAFGFGPLTTLLQVRRDAFSEITPEAQKLTNRDFIELKKIRDPRQRYLSVLQKLGVPPESALVPSLSEAFEKYYSRGLNSAPLNSYGKLLEALALGKLLSKTNTRRMLKWLAGIHTGEKRIKAGLPRDLVFSQKTGTQLDRVCNVGIITRTEEEQLPPAMNNPIIIIASCAERFHSPAEGDRLLRKMGEALTHSGIFAK